MKKTIKLALAASMVLGASSAFATNGDHLIGLGAKARGMGGIGIGMSHGAESGLANPALITSVKNTEVSFGGTLFMPNVSADMGMGYSDSAADMSMIPEVAIANKVNDNFFWGVGMWGTAGMGVDYREEEGMTSNFNMVTNLQLMQFGIPLTYAVSGFSVGVTPILQYGALDINYAGTLDDSNLGGTGYDAAAGAGVAQDFGFGFNIGLAYEIAGVTIGAVYKSAIDMEYKDQISGATQPFVMPGMVFDEALGDNLEQPAEIGIGVSYAIAGNTIAVDFKQIKWGDAKGYKDFGWENQNVFALGYEYAADVWAVRAGFNYGKNPVDEQDGTTGAGAATNMFNALGFPATTESHYTLGGTYAFNEQISLDGAFTYAPETETTYDMSAMANFGPQNPTSVTVKHSQTALTAQLNFTF